MRHALCATLIATALSGSGAFAQGLQTEGAIEAIVGSEVNEQESTTAADRGKIIAAIDKAGESAQAARMLTVVAGLDIVFLAGATNAEGGPPDAIKAKLAEREREVVALREEIESNALLFHAIDSRQVLMTDVMAIEIGEDRHVTVYAAGSPPGQ